MRHQCTRRLHMPILGLVCQQTPRDVRYQVHLVHNAIGFRHEPIESLRKPAIPCARAGKVVEGQVLVFRIRRKIQGQKCCQRSSQAMPTYGQRLHRQRKHHLGNTLTQAFGSMLRIHAQRHINLCKSILRAARVRHEGAGNREIEHVPDPLVDTARTAQSDHDVAVLILRDESDRHNQFAPSLIAPGSQVIGKDRREDVVLDRHSPQRLCQAGCACLRRQDILRRLHQSGVVDCGFPVQRLSSESRPNYVMFRGCGAIGLKPNVADRYVMSGFSPSARSMTEELVGDPFGTRYPCRNSTSSRCGVN